MYAYRIAYDGREYHGFQRQPDVPTVEDGLLEALRSLDICGAETLPEGYAAASRTDAGVSATAQTVAFEAPAWLSPAALNSRLPEPIRAWGRAAVPASFHATHDATARQYVYHLYAPEADPGRVRTLLDRLAGRHDFHNLTPDESGTTRSLSVGLRESPPFLELRVRADGFPRQLVRRAVGLVTEALEAGPGRIERALGPESLSGPAGISPAPPEALVLTTVQYPAVAFSADDDAAARAQALFERRRVSHATNAHVAAAIADAVGTE